MVSGTILSPKRQYTGRIPNLFELLRRNVGVPDDVPALSATHRVDVDPAVVQGTLKAVPTLNALASISLKEHSRVVAGAGKIASA